VFDNDQKVCEHSSEIDVQCPENGNGLLPIGIRPVRERNPGARGWKVRTFPFTQTTARDGKMERILPCLDMLWDTLHNTMKM
jgi:hypothetical protein